MSCRRSHAVARQGRPPILPSMAAASRHRLRRAGRRFDVASDAYRALMAGAVENGSVVQLLMPPWRILAETLVRGITYVPRHVWRASARRRRRQRRPRRPVIISGVDFASASSCIDRPHGRVGGGRFTMTRSRPYARHSHWGEIDRLSRVLAIYLLRPVYDIHNRRPARRRGGHHMPAYCRASRYRCRPTADGRHRDAYYRPSILWRGVDTDVVAAVAVHDRMIRRPAVLGLMMS